MSSLPWQPTFLVIGAVKAATTWIQTRLQDNPLVFLPDAEPHYFSTHFERGEDYYRDFFRNRAAAVRVVGEKSADYLAHPLAAQRVAAMLPLARLVVQLRNPVERAYSDYKMFYRRGFLMGPPEEYLSDLDNPFPRFLTDGMYASHLMRWLELFPREQFLTCLYDDVDHRPREILQRVSAHIGVEPVFRQDCLGQRENNSGAPILPLPLRKALSPLKGAVRVLRGNALFETARSLLAREIAYPPLTPELRQRLIDFYARDVELLETICGIDLGHWKAASAGEGDPRSSVGETAVIPRGPGPERSVGARSANSP